MSATTHPSLDFFKGLKTAPLWNEGERQLRIENGKDILPFGVSFLDECLGGIAKNDLIVLGAKTGFGKSQLASLIAKHNILNGKRVLFFALEAEEREIERRIKYQLISDWYFNLKANPGFKLNYLDWYYGRLNDHLELIEKEIDEQFSLFSNLSTFYRQGDFNIQEFLRFGLGLKDETDLIIVDHLHYFDFDEQNENQAMKDTVKKIRDLALITNKPVILISHVRKSDKKSKQLIPDLEDFHGSSDIGKIATKAITIAPCFEETLGKQRLTYFQALKCRVDGARANMTGLLSFNTAMHKYERQYQLGRLSHDGTEFKPFKFNEMPEWAKNATASQN